MVIIEDMSWVAPKNMYAGSRKEEYICKSQHCQLLGESYLHLLTVLGILKKKPLRHTPLLLLRKFQIGIIEECRS